MPSGNAERLALDELHAAVQQAGNDFERVEALVKNAPVPTSEDLLIEAGTRVLPLLDGDHADADRARLDALTSLLRTRAGAGSAGERAVSEFQARIAEHDRQRASDERVGGRMLLGCAVVLVALVGVVAYLLLAYSR